MSPSEVDATRLLPTSAAAEEAFPTDGQAGDESPSGCGKETPDKYVTVWTAPKPTLTTLPKIFISIPERLLSGTKSLRPKEYQLFQLLYHSYCSLLAFHQFD